MRPETPMEETLEAFGKLIKAGKVRAIGASNFQAERLAMALKIAEEGGFPRYCTLQPLTIWWSAISSMRCSRCVWNRRSVSFPFIPWRPVFSAANTAAG